MTTVRIQALDIKNEWATLAQLDHTEAAAYINSFRSDHFLAAVEENLRRTAEQQLKDGKIETMPAIAAEHLRKIRSDPNAIRIVPAWKPGDSAAQDIKTCNLQ